MSGVEKPTLTPDDSSDAKPEKHDSHPGIKIQPPSRETELSTNESVREEFDNLPPNIQEKILEWAQLKIDDLKEYERQRDEISEGHEEIYYPEELIDEGVRRIREGA
jgi:mRNA-degrading endonuclease RelE of RelBE toxin-antitoxin system